MHLRTTAPLRRALLALALLALLSSTLAASLAVHPFSSEDPLLGVAIADEVAATFHDHAIVFGPDVAAGLIPPLVVADGFINLGRVLGVEEWTGPSGPGLVRSGTGVDVAVSGVVEQYDERTLLRLEVAYEGGTRRVELSAEPGDRAHLVALATRVVAPLLGLTSPPEPVRSPPLEGGYEAYVRSVALASSGLVADAAMQGTEPAEGAAAESAWPERGDELTTDLEAALDGELDLETEPLGDDFAAARRLARRAMFAISLPAFHEADAGSAFRALGAVSGMPLTDAWEGVLAADRGDYEAAAAAFEAAHQPDYLYGAALLASTHLATGDVPTALELVDLVAERGPEAGAAALMGASIVAYLAEDTERQKVALTALGRAAPFLAYPHQELSFIAFDEDDALAAAQALAVAVELEPDSSLYWTNLGWATYLLGFLERSEEASKRAIELDGNQYIAAYNLGLVRAVTGRLTEALEAYDYAVARDPAVHDEVIVDLVNARTLYPGASAVEYALARLYEAKGQRSDARAAYRRFLSQAGAGNVEAEYAAYVDTARERLAALSGPLPPLEILGEVDVRLGQRGPEARPFHPGDPLYPSFELSTPGEQLPGLIDVVLTLTGAEGEEGGEPIATTEGSVEVPSGAVGYVVDFLWLELPDDLPAGDYRINVEATSGDELAVNASTPIDVAGAPVPLRQLIGRNVVMTGLAIETPLYSRNDLGRTSQVIESMVTELREAAPAAEEALPVIRGGRFEGMTGSELFLAATADDVREFLAYVAATDTRDTRFIFVDGYAQWAIDGAPAPN